MIKTVVKIEGMKCPMCEAHVNDAIKENFEVKSVVSSHVDKMTTIRSKQGLDADKLKGVIAELGFTVQDVAEEEVKPKLFGFLKK